MPHVVECSLDLPDQRDDRVDEKRKANRAKDPCLDVIHKTNDATADLDPFLSQRLQEVQQQRFNLVVYPEPLQNGEAEGKQWHQSKQCGIDQAHRLEGELTFS